MGCNCGKSKNTPPTGGRSEPSTPAGPIPPASRAAPGTSTPAQRPNQQAFTGQTESYTSTLASRAEQVRRQRDGVR